MKYILHILLLLLTISISAQEKYPFKITLEPVIPEGFTGLQSYAWAKNGDMILLVGGRTDGLHRRQPFAAFTKTYNNTELIVWDMKSNKVWKKNIQTLPASISEQLQSSNMEFYQQDDQLIVIGGYGYSETKREHITYPSVISINVNDIIQSIVNNKSIEPYILQLSDERMAVTGGRLAKLKNVYYLVGGQRFDGRYNPHGPDHGPGFSQQYTNQIRKFNLEINRGKLSIQNYSAITDSLLLHRRDYNLIAQINEKGNSLLTIFSGVFQYEKEIPFTTLIDINESGHSEVPDFNQQFSHYHTATLPVYSKVNKKMYNVFFGGIAQYSKGENSEVVKDDNIPFVKSISVVERNSGKTKEYVMPDPMPGYFGAAAEFISVSNKLFIEKNILDFDKIKGKQLVGYIIGGIDSRAPNVFWSNDSDASRASPVIWEVHISK